MNFIFASKLKKENEELNKTISKMTHDFNNEKMKTVGYNEIIEENKQKELFNLMDIRALYLRNLEANNFLNIKNKYILNKKQLIRDTLEGFGELNEHLEEILNFFNEVISAMTENSAAITQTANNVENVKSNQSELKNITLNGKNSVSDLEESIKNIKDQSSKISEFVEIIKNISSQTNLLAMNASIEAAHAGEYGKGFTVVANEIRKLSEETNLNIKNITKNAKEIVKNIKNCSEKSKSSKNNFIDISNKTNNILEAVIEISAASREQSASTAQITNNLGGDEGIIQKFSSIKELFLMVVECFKTLFDDLK